LQPQDLEPTSGQREWGNGAERNRTAVRSTGVSHLVRSKPDLAIVAALKRLTMDQGQGV